MANINYIIPQKGTKIKKTMKKYIRIDAMYVFEVPKNEKKRKNKKRKYPKEFMKIRKELLKIWYCSDCRSTKYLQVHHLDKDIHNNSIDNLMVLCYYCHSKHHKHMQNKRPPKWIK